MKIYWSSKYIPELKDLPEAERVWAYKACNTKPFKETKAWKYLGVTLAWYLLCLFIGFSIPISISQCNVFDLKLCSLKTITEEREKTRKKGEAERGSEGVPPHFTLCFSVTGAVPLASATPEMLPGPAELYV